MGQDKNLRTWGKIKIYIGCTKMYKGVEIFQQNETNLIRNHFIYDMQIALKIYTASTPQTSTELYQIVSRCTRIIQVD